MIPAALPIALHLLLAAPRIVGGGACPTAVDVQIATEALVFPPESATHLAQLEELPGELRLTLFDDQHRTLGQRTFPAALSGEPDAGDSVVDCRGLASAAALALVLWETTPTALELPLPELPPPAPTQTEAPIPVPAPTPTPSKSWLDLGAGPLLSVALDGQSALAGSVYVIALDPSRRWGGLLSLMGETQRQVADGVNWSRWTLGLGAERRWTSGDWSVSAELDLDLALLLAQGNGTFPGNLSATADPGATLGGRVRWRPSRWGVWAGVFAIAWPFPVALAFSGQVGSPSTVPQGELLFGLGFETSLAAAH